MNGHDDLKYLTLFVLDINEFKIHNAEYDIRFRVRYYCMLLI